MNGNGDELTHPLIGAAIEVHKGLGPGLLEAVYEACMAHKLALRGLSVERQKARCRYTIVVSNSNVAIDRT